MNEAMDLLVCTSGFALASSCSSLRLVYPLTELDRDLHKFISFRAAKDSGSVQLLTALLSLQL